MLKRLSTRIRRWLQDGLARNTGAVTAAQLVRVGTQALYFILIARALGPSGYGAFAAAAALVGVFTPFASWGAGDLLVERVARRPEDFAGEWASALLRIVIFGGAGIGLAGLAGVALLSGVVPLGLILVLATAEFLFASAVAIAAQAFQAFEQLPRTGQAWVLLSALRLLAAVALIAIDTSPTAQEWANLYLVANVIAAAVAIVVVGRELGWPRWERAAPTGRLVDGFLYSVGLSAASVHNDIDKTIIARSQGSSPVGPYAAGHRAVEMALIPVMAVLYSSYARFFRAGEKGVRGSLGLAGEIAPPMLGYAVLASLAVWAVSPTLEWVLGAEYADAAVAARWLAPLVVLRTAQFVAANALTGAGRQGQRSAVQMIAAAANVGLSIFLISRYGWIGAAWATLGSELVLAGALWLVAVALARTEEEAVHEVAHSEEREATSRVSE